MLENLIVVISSQEDHGSNRQWLSFCDRTYKLFYTVCIAYGKIDELVSQKAWMIGVMFTKDFMSMKVQVNMMIASGRICYQIKIKMSLHCCLIYSKSQICTWSTSTKQTRCPSQNYWNCQTYWEKRKNSRSFLYTRWSLITPWNLSGNASTS